MTIQDKNIAIAEMIGWKFKGIIIDFIPGTWKEEDVTQYSSNHLKFDTDANWQFEAIDFIENNYSQPHYITSKLNIYISKCCLNKKHRCEISMDDRFLPKFSIHIEESTRKEAIFEALYQFSQHLIK